MPNAKPIGPRARSAALVGILSALALEPAFASCPPDSTVADYVYGGGLCLAAETFGARSAGAAPVLIVVVHGDISDGGAATYHAGFARTLSRAGIVVVALIRPGYWDAAGRTSQGDAHGRKDNYTARNIAAIGGAIDVLKKHYRARRVVYVGHSGGAAIGGVLIARQRGLVDAAVLVSCPCDIPRWLKARGYAPWTRSESPAFHAYRVPVTTEVVAITGAADDNTAPGLAEDYVASLKKRGVRARFEAVEGAGHRFSGVAAATAKAVEGLIAR
jgi:pimeloyl-ACP methyl ester carboxylesterase